MKKNILTASAILLSILLASCEKEIKFKGEYDGEKLVLFSCVNPDTVINASVYHSTFFLSSNEYAFMDAIQLAKVSAVIDGNEHPLHFDKESGRYVCGVKPSVGSKVVVKASLEGYKPVQGETEVPKRPKVSFTMGDIEPINDEDGRVKQYKVHLKIIVEGAEEDVNYLRLKAFRKADMCEDEEDDSDEHFEESNEWVSEKLMTNDLAFFGTDAVSLLDDFGDTDPYSFIPDCFDDGKLIKGRAVDAWMVIDQVFDGIYGNQDSFQLIEKKMNFDISNFKVTVESLSKDLFRYLKSREAYISKDEGIGSIFSEPVAVSNNIKGGIGCVGAVSSTTASH